jgi:hypothetical protein
MLAAMSRSDRHPRRRRLAEEHAAFDALFEQVRSCVEEGDWWECDVIWGRFCKALEDHFCFEERELWPEFDASTPSAHANLSVLKADHADIRATLDRIGIEIDLKRVDRAAIEQLIDQLRAHVQHENELFYPWASASANPSVVE